MRKKAEHTIYSDLDKVFAPVPTILNKFKTSTIIQNYFLLWFYSFVYGNLINNVFQNLNNQNVKENGWDKMSIAAANKKFKVVKRQVNLALTMKANEISPQYYHGFKRDFVNSFPAFRKIIYEIEREVNMSILRKYLNAKRKQLRNFGNSNPDFSAMISTQIVEMYILKKKKFSTNKQIMDLMKKVLNRKFLSIWMKNIGEQMYKSLNRRSKMMLLEQRKQTIRFESKIYKIWKEPIDLLESIIRICYEVGDKKNSQLTKNLDDGNKHKITALIRIHARAIQITNEILSLIKAGYPDGAFARWRSLHELAVISIFLKSADDDLSERYLCHEPMKNYKDAVDYIQYHKKLGEPALGLREIRVLKMEYDKLIEKYGKEFKYGTGFEWIPSGILPTRNFRNLERHIKLDKLHPYYNFSANVVHGGPRGFYRLGLKNDRQTSIHLTGPSVYSSVDCFQETAQSLLYTTINLISIDSNIEDLFAMAVLPKYVRQIALRALEADKHLQAEK